MSHRIGLVEDEPVIRQNFTELLERRGYAVDAYPDRDSALHAFREGLPDAVLLDVALGDEHDGGYQVCLELRRMSTLLPIIFLTAHDQEADRISGLRMGADDYLSKRASFDYLLVRIETLLRRAEQLRARMAETAADAPAMAADLPHVDAEALIIYWHGQRVVLSLTQFWIAQALLESPGSVRSHKQLMDAARIRVEPNTIAAHIKNIRQAFCAVDASFDAIRAERGKGYRWIPG